MSNKKLSIDHRTPSTHQQFTKEVELAAKDGFAAYQQSGEMFFSDSSSIHVQGFGEYIDANSPVYQLMQKEIKSTKVPDGRKPVMGNECSLGSGMRGGILMGTDATMLDWSQNSFSPVNDGVGTDGLGYAVWGPWNAVPTAIYRSTAANPLTASVLDYLERTLFGLGCQIVYCISRYSGGTVTHEEVPYRDADVYLKQDIVRLIEKVENLKASEESKKTPSDNSTSVLGVNVPTPNNGSSSTSKLIAHYEKQLEEAEKALESYWKTRGEIDAFLENNNLSYFHKRWIADSIRLGIAFPMIGLSRSGSGKWEPKIAQVEIRDACVMRLEERNPDHQNKIDYVYESERWRADANVKLKIDEYIAHPAIMPEHALGDLRSEVAKHHRTKVSERPYWFCCPNYQPTPTKLYYPQLSWWSIFPSQVYQYASTIIYDKAAAKRNSTMWGKILFINTAYLAQIFNQSGEKGKTPEGQAEIRKGIYSRVEDFLKRRDNNGKLLVMDSYPSADEKQMIDSVRIVDVPQNTDVKASVSELTEMASLVSYAFGVNIDLIGSRPGTEAKSTGTAQRELHLLKNGQLSPDRITFTDFFNKFVFPFNGWDAHFHMVVNYPTLTTLDNSKTGTIDMHDGR